MSIHLRTITDERGDAVDYAWYCGDFCYAESLRADPPSATFEQGGAYPCGAEHDDADYCAQCGAAVGNPLTDEGAAYVREYVSEVDERAPYRIGAEHEARAEDLRRQYDYLFEQED